MDSYLVWNRGSILKLQPRNRTGAYHHGRPTKNAEGGIVPLGGMMRKAKKKIRPLRRGSQERYLDRGIPEGQHSQSVRATSNRNFGRSSAGPIQRDKDARVVRYESGYSIRHNSWSYGIQSQNDQISNHHAPLFIIFLHISFIRSNTATPFSSPLWTRHRPESPGASPTSTPYR